MKYSVSVLVLASFMAMAADVPPNAPVMPLPVFLKSGFSSVLEFEETPTKVILGDSQAFQVEKLDRSLVVRTVAPYATSNLFVYFKEAAPKLFVLTAAEDAEPTYFRKFENPTPPQTKESKNFSVRSIPVVSRVVSANWDAKKDYLTIELILAANSRSLMKPKWDLIRLRHLTNTQAPFKLWSERKEAQKDAAIRARLIFSKPNIPRDLNKALVIVPLEGDSNPLTLSLRGSPHE